MAHCHRNGESLGYSLLPPLLPMLLQSGFGAFFSNRKLMPLTATEEN